MVTDKARGFVVGAVRRSRMGNADAVPEPGAPVLPMVIGVEGTGQNAVPITVSARSLAVACQRMEEDLGPDPEDPNGERAYDFVLSVAK